MDSIMETMDMNSTKEALDALRSDFAARYDGQIASLTRALADTSDSERNTRAALETFHAMAAALRDYPVLLVDPLVGDMCTTSTIGQLYGVRAGNIMGSKMPAAQRTPPDRRRPSAVKGAMRAKAKNLARRSPGALPTGRDSMSK